MPRTPLESGAIQHAYLSYTRRTRRRAPKRTGGTASDNECTHNPSLRLLEGKELETSDINLQHDIPSCTRLSSSIEPSLGRQLHPESYLASKILQLPAEIRVMILRQVVSLEESEHSMPVFDVLSGHLVTPSFVNIQASSVDQDSRPHSVLRVLEVCRTFYLEGVGLFYTVNALRVSSPSMLFNFLRDISRSRRKYLRRLRIGGFGFHYTGWQLARQAFSLLKLCTSLKEIILELSWNSSQSTEILYYGLSWRAVLTQNDLGVWLVLTATHGSYTPWYIEELRKSTICLKALRGLKSFDVQAVVADKPSPWQDDDELDGSMLELRREASAWVKDVQSFVTRGI